MAKIISLSLLALCALLLPIYGQEAQPQSAGLKTGNAGAGSPGSGLNWLPGPGLGRRCQRRREVVKRCVSSTCGEYKCSDLYRFRERLCTADCRTGCFCAWPFFRNNDGRCVHFWQCYNYRRPRWPAVRPSGGFDQGAAAYPGGSGSASLPASSAGAGYGPQPGAGGSVGGWPSAAGLMPGGAGSTVNVVPSGGWSSGVGQYPGAGSGAAFPQYPGSWSSGFGNGVSGGANGGFGAVSGGVGSGSGGFGVGSGNFGVGGGSLGGSSGVLGSGPGFGVGNGNFGVGGGSRGGSSGVFGSAPGIGGSASGGFGSITGSGAFGSGNVGGTNVKAQG
uniref:TIL domain containing protein n=1 Tax=Rhipicephalus zambeziensis TaxID=60191 RepID=A0A224YL44_9ACAR